MHKDRTAEKAFSWNPEDKRTRERPHLVRTSHAQCSIYYAHHMGRHDGEGHPQKVTVKLDCPVLHTGWGWTDVWMD